MWFLDYFWSVLDSLGFVWRKDAKILFLGLDNAGKTTLMKMLKDGMLKQYPPTQHATQQELTIGSTKFRAFDIGGHAMARKVWKDYFPEVSAIAFLIDAHERMRFDEAKTELDGLMALPELSDVPILVLGNKVDLPHAASEDELRIQLGLVGKTTGKDTQKGVMGGSRPIELYMCSVVRQFGFGEGFRWLNRHLN